MARFPDREAEIKALAQSIITGLTSNPDFPNPPVSPAELQAQRDSFISLGDTQVADQAKAQLSTEAKQVGREQLTGSLKSALRYAEDAVDGNSAKLAALGWSGGRDRGSWQAWRSRLVNQERGKEWEYSSSSMK